MRISLVVAAARNQVIGRGDEIPWRLPDDQRFFRRVTMGHVIIMGRKTFNTIGKPLPGRTNLVLSRRESMTVEGGHVFAGLESAEAWARDRSTKEFFVIGGEALYRESLPRAHRLFLTRVDAEPSGDVFFPEIDEALWHCVRRESHSIDERHAHAFTIETWERRG